MNQNVNDAYKDKQNSNQSEGDISSQELLNDVNNHLKIQQKALNKVGIFKYGNANTWIGQAKDRPMPKTILDILFFQYEMCVLFADSNMGKSIFAVQIANAVTKGTLINGFSKSIDKQKVLYFDFELSDKQFEIRYSDRGKNHYHFDNNFIRVELTPDDDMLKEGFELVLFRDIKYLIETTGVRILIIDNLTYLSLKEPEKAKNALPLLHELQKLKKKYQLTILVLAHTPKRDMARPITQNDLGGSKMFMNFFDSAFAIGKSHQDEGLRYIKQIKVRSAEERFGANNVCMCQIIKENNNFLKFDFLHYDEESNHLKRLKKDKKQVLISEVKRLKEEGKSHRKISKELGISIGSVTNYLNKTE